MDFVARNLTRRSPPPPSSRSLLHVQAIQHPALHQDAPLVVKNVTGDVGDAGNAEWMIRRPMHGVLIKTYSNDSAGAGRYSPPIVVGTEREVHCGSPRTEHISTSFVERSNLTMRMGMRRYTRLTNGFSKKVENHAHMTAIFFTFYNFCRRHMTIKTTPAIAAGLVDRVWGISDLIDLISSEV
jgi:hypothetical protein